MKDLTVIDDLKEAVKIARSKVEVPGISQPTKYYFDLQGYPGFSMVVDLDLLLDVLGEENNLLNKCITIERMDIVAQVTPGLAQTPTHSIPLYDIHI